MVNSSSCSPPPRLLKHAMCVAQLHPKALTIPPPLSSLFLQDCVGYVMGRGGQVLRSMEEEWGTLMFFAKTRVGSYTVSTHGFDPACFQTFGV